MLWGMPRGGVRCWSWPSLLVLFIGPTPGSPRPGRPCQRSASVLLDCPAREWPRCRCPRGSPPGCTYCCRQCNGLAPPGGRVHRDAVGYLDHCPVPVYVTGGVMGSLVLGGGMGRCAPRLSPLIGLAGTQDRDGSIPGAARGSGDGCLAAGSVCAGRRRAQNQPAGALTACWDDSSARILGPWVLPCPWFRRQPTRSGRDRSRDDPDGFGTFCSGLVGLGWPGSVQLSSGESRLRSEAARTLRDVLGGVAQSEAAA
jgi:hypothetical protein